MAGFVIDPLIVRAHGDSHRGKLRGNWMALSALDDKSKKPEDGSLAEALGKSLGLWQAIDADLSASHRGVENEWRFTSPRYGWILRARHKKRTILYMTPGEGSIKMTK